MNAMHRPARLLVFLLAALTAAGPALSGPPSWAGGGKHGGGADEERHAPHGAKHTADDRVDPRVDSRDVGKGSHYARKPTAPGAYFDDRNRASVQKYFAAHPGKACPPGLAKKNNGCLPPGQAKKLWAVGQPLPSTVVLQPVPSQILVTLPPVPVGHRYVEVAGDILLIAVGSKMVVDGINGLMR